MTFQSARHLARPPGLIRDRALGKMLHDAMGTVGFDSGVSGKGWRVGSRKVAQLVFELGAAEHPCG